MRVIQLVPGLSARDAVGNEVLSLDRILRDAGYSAYIFTPWINGLEPRENICLGFEEFELKADDIIIYHFAIGSYLTDYFMRAPCRTVLCYHNVTPSAFFSPYDLHVAKGCERGRLQVEMLVPYVDHCLADSEFNKQELVEMGYACPIDVIPIALDPQEYEGKIDEDFYDSLKKAHGSQVLFVGRVAPNKCFEDVVRAFHVYKERYDQDACLNLIGSFDPNDPYYQALIKYIKKLGTADVVFMGSVSFPRLNACYKGSDILLCQSEHEGFCVPLVEAMMHDLPIVGYDCCAVGETMGEGALALSTKDPEIVAGIMNKVITDVALSNRVILHQRQQMKKYDPEAVAQRFLNAFSRIVDAL